MNTIQRLLLTVVLTVVALLQLPAQTGNLRTVGGRICDADDGTPLELVNISLAAGAYWAVSDMNGRFTLHLPDGDYSYEVSYIGYEKASGTLHVKGKDITTFTVKLQPSSLGLGEVVVTAKEKTMGSSSVIDRTALQHLQPKSVEDILQLLPGNLTKNPSLDEIGQAYIREIDGSAQNALGTSVVVDGAPVSNDANLQALNTAKNGTSSYNSTMSAQNTAGKGVDLRSLSTDNIENIEVVRGIPSAEYGNLTAGAVIVKTKQGATPLEMNVKVDPNSKIYYAGKGFRTTSGTTVNLSADYTTSYSDTRQLAKGFERITGSLGASHTFGQERPLSMNAKLSYFQNINSVRIDPQQYAQDVMQNENQGLRFSLGGDWNLHTRLLSNLSYNVTASYSHQSDYLKNFFSLPAGITPIGTATETSIYESYFLTRNYYAEHTVDGQPLDLFAQLKGSKTLTMSDDFVSTFKGGAEWKYNKNYGRGIEFDPQYPPMASANDVQSIRPRPCYDVPAMKTFSAFAENKTMVPLGTTRLTASAGVRASRLFIDRDYLATGDMSAVEPRLNGEWHLLTEKNNRLLDNLSLTGGWGLTTKMPPLIYLYPDKAYFDERLFTYVNTASKQYLAVLSTLVVDDTTNPSLRPERGRKAEVGVSAASRQLSGSVTFFNEHYRNGFSFTSVPLSMPHAEYSIPDQGAENIRFVAGNLYYDVDGQQRTAVLTPDTTFHTYYQPNNNVATSKMGVEYTLNLGQIQALRTSIVVDGAWLHIERRTQNDYWSEVTSTGQAEDYPYIALMPGGRGTVSDRVNTNVRFITHIPALKMVFSTTAQVVWGETSRSVWQDDDGTSVLLRGLDRSSSSTIERYYVEPVGYMDFAGNYYTWQHRDIKDYPQQLYYMIDWYSNAQAFDTEHYPAYAIFNFRLTKEFGKRMELSFMANNMFNSRKVHKNVTSGSYSVLTIPQYFGAELKLKI